MFLALIGAEAGHMGLRSLASGGVYICGGIMPKVCCCMELPGNALYIILQAMHLRECKLSISTHLLIHVPGIWFQPGMYMCNHMLVSTCDTM